LSSVRFSACLFSPAWVGVGFSVSRFLMNRRWSWLACLLVVVLAVAVLPVTPARAAAKGSAAVAGDGWKPASKRNWWDRLWGLHGSNKAPKGRDLGVGGVPRKDPVPQGQKLPPAKRVRELTSRRTANARYYQMSDGTTQAEISQQPVNYRSGGGWKPIDTKVTASKAGGFSYGNQTNSFRSSFGTTSGRLVRFDAGGGASLTFGPESGVSAKPVVKDNTVTYPGAVAGADLSYAVRPDSLKESIVLATAPASASWSFAVRVKGLRAWQRPDGAIAFYRGGFDGPPALVMPKPYMSDAKTDTSSPYGKAWSPKVSQSMRWDARAGLLHITVSADRKWLSDPKRVYPVVVDPTIVLQPLPENSQDAMIESDTPTSNYESSWRLSVGTTSGGVARSLVKFPVNIPTGTHILSADLQMYYDQTFGPDTQDATIEAHRATAPWDETTATWNNASSNVGELGYYRVYVDNGVSGHTAAVGAWPATTSTLGQYGYNGDYLYNKDNVSGDSYTWWPTLAESGDYQVETHYVAASDRATNAPYKVTYNGGTASYSINQQSGTNGVWASLGTHPFAAGSAGKVTLNDTPASSTTAVIADAARWTKNGTALRPANDNGSHWHTFAVRNIVQSWVDGTNPNYGFVLKAADEATLNVGGPRYEGSVYAYNGETAQYPKLVITYGKPGVAVNEPTTIHSTGADLTWPAYVDPSTSSSDDIVEYQVHRSIYQDFTPTAATLVAPVDKGSTSFSDTTATPTPADSADPYGNLYYYMVAVKTADGSIVPGPTQIVRLPKAGRTIKVYQASADTTLSSLQPSTNEDKLAGEAWLSVGNNSSVYGVTRSVINFPAMTDIPSTAQVVDGRVALWSAGMTGNAQATYEAHGLTKDFAETSATWNNATSTTAWTAAGGDYTSTVAGSFSPITNDPARRTFPITSLAQGWVTTPSSNHGVLFRLANETTPGEHTTFLSSEADEPDLRPQLFVTYLDKTTDSTYYAPSTPTLMDSGGQYTVNVDVSGTVNRTLTKADNVLTYQWTLPDGTDVTGASQVQTPLPQDIAPGDTATVAAQVNAPVQAAPDNKRTDYVLHWNVYNKTTGQSLPASDGIPSLDQSVAVEEPTSDQLGLEKFYQYAGKNTGAGGTVMDNLYAGNAVWSYNPINNPGRGLSTFVRMAYNSLDTSDTSMGFGWSLQAAGPTRLGSPLDFHPNPNPTTVTMTDGDGTSHTFSWDASANGGAGEWTSPHGVHYYLQRQVVCSNKTEESRAWVMTRPDRTQFFYDCDGYLSAVVDKNGNEQDFTYSSRKSNNKPIKFLSYITDPAGRQSLTLDYYAKGDDYTYIDDSGNEVSDTNLTNPHIIDQVRSVTDISGRKIFFTYSDKGLMAKMVDGSGDAAAKTFRFTYDATQGNKNVKLVKVTDPRGHDTSLDYYYPQNGDDPEFHWDLKTITDRLNGTTGFAYTDPDGPQGSTIQTVVTDPETHTSTYLMDGLGRPTQTTNAKNQVTKLGWDTDHNVTSLQEDNGAVSTWTYDPLTGYPLTQKDAEANQNGTAGTTLTYQTGLNGHIASLISKTSPEGRVYTFGYDTLGNLTSVTDPDGNATSTAGDYTTTSAYDLFGQLTKSTNANGHATQYLNYDPNGYPQTITDPLGKSTKFVYDARGEVTKVTDALGHDTTQNYDLFGRPTDKTVPKDQAAGKLITTPAPVYDANDNVLQSTAPNGAVTTATYDVADQVISSSAPKDTDTGPERKTNYEYDKAGNVTKVIEPKGTLTTTDDTDYVTTYGYDEIYEQTSVTNANGDKLTYAYDDVGNVTTVVDPRKNATADTTDYTTKYTYDLDHRPKTLTDAAGKSTSTVYDRDGLTTAHKDQDGTTTTAELDARGAVIQVTVPHSTGVDNVTQYEYDQVGNRTKVITPRGVATTGVADDYVQQTNYDELNRVKEKLTPYDPNDARYNHADATIYSYDDAGRLSNVSAPPSNGQTIRNNTGYTYFDNGWTKTSTDPWDIVTSYDYDDLGQQTSRTLTSAGGSSSRTMGWTYYPDGKLKGRTDDGVPVGQQVVLVDDSDIQNAGYNGTAWTTGSTGSGFQGYDYATHAAGTGANSFVWNLTIPEDGTYQVYAKYPTVSGAATNASYTVRDGAGGTANKTVNQSSGGGTWVSLGSYTFKRDGTGQQVTLSDAANGTVVADAVKLVRDNSGDTDNEKTDFSYAYDPNGNLTDITDNSPGTKIDAYAVTYDGLNQVSKVEEKAAGTVKHTTTYTYNENGEPATRGHDDESATYEYDVRDMVSKVTDKASASDTSPKITSFTYTSRGQQDVQTKGNGNTVNDDYYLDGSLQYQVEKKPNGTIVSEHTYSYDPNGNKSQDVAKTMNADDHAAYLNTTTNYTYDPLDRIAQVTKTGASSDTETYVHDPNNNVVSQTIKGTTTTYNYDRNRLLTAVTGGTTADYNYDPFGRLDTVTSAGQVIERNTYDGFDHVTENQQRDSGGSLVTTKYTYDPLDRTTSETTNAGGASEKTTNYVYLGLSDQVMDEEVAGQITKSYQYSPWGERLSQVKTNTDGSTEDAYYGYNDHTDVETLTDSAGDTKATYGYTAYGQSNDAETTGIDKPDPADPTKEPYNAYRFEAKRWDPNSGTYDMGFRDYAPGLNQFLTRDTYNGALNDQNLSTDPFTANRYAFTGGNPITNVELDGHRPDVCMAGGDAGACSAYARAAAGLAGNGGNASAPRLVSVSPHVFVPENDPNLKALQENWQWAISHLKGMDEAHKWEYLCELPGDSPCNYRLKDIFMNTSSGTSFLDSTRAARIFNAGLNLLIGTGSGGLAAAIMLPPQPRGADGKYLPKNGGEGRDGAAEEKMALDELSTDAEIIPKEIYAQVTIDGETMLRKYDGAVKIDDVWYGVEVKGGKQIDNKNGGKRGNQPKIDEWLNTPGNTVEGKVAGEERWITLEGTMDVWSVPFE
jgi:RHS repeat-associated protein